MNKRELLAAAKYPDWGQVVANGGPPCFHVAKDGYGKDRFCFRTSLWPGHGEDHPYVSLLELLSQGEAHGRDGS